MTTPHTPTTEVKMCHLELYCWAFSIGGEHYSASLMFDDGNGELQRVELKHPLTQKQATYLNKKDQTQGRIHQWKRGELSERFDTEQEAVRAAVKQWRKIAPHCYALIRGGWAVSDPCEVLDGPEPFKSKVNAMVAKKKSVGGYEKDEKTCDQLFEQYQALLKTLTA